MKDQKVGGSISRYVFDITSHKSDIPGIDVKNLETLINTIMKLAIPQVNNILKAGIAIPSIEGISFDNSDISFKDKYIIIQSSPAFSGADIEKITNSLVRGLLSRALGNSDSQQMKMLKKKVDEGLMLLINKAILTRDF